MDLVFPEYVQFRTLTETYLCKVSADKVVLKIYDLADKCLYQIKSATSDPRDILVQLSRDPVSLFKKLMEEKATAFNFASFKAALPELEEVQTILKQAMRDLQSGMIVTHEPPGHLKCSITMDVFKDPTSCSCGHTFEKEEIESATKDNKICPLDRKPITWLAPNYAIKSALEEWQQLNSIPTFASFKRENRALAQANLTTAKASMEGGELSQTVRSYKEAFRHTKDLEEYAAIPELYKTLGETDKARLSYLYLTSYLIEAGDIPAALGSLEKAKTLELPPSLPLHCALIMLARYAKHRMKPERVKQLIQEATALLQSVPPAKAREFANLLLSQDVTNTSLYDYLSTKAGNENERKQLLLKGALHALHGEKFSEAKRLCDQITPTTFEDVLVVFQSDQKELTLLEEYAAKALKDKQFKPARQAFKILLSHQEKPDYYEKLIDSYFEEGKLQKVFSKAMRLAELLVSQGYYARSEKVCERALEAAPNPDQTLQLYKKLEIAYLKTDSPKLKNLWAKLGRIYEDTQDMTQAQQTYEKAQDKFKTQFFSFKLAHLLEKKGQLKESLFVYYAQAEQDILNRDLKGLEACYQEMLKVDPQLRHLDGLQKTQLVFQRQILKLEGELARVSQRVEELEKPSKLELERPEAKRPRLEKLPEGCFGKEQWFQYFGDVGLEPPLPGDIHDILRTDCPFWPGKKVQETHMLVLIPKTVNERPLTLNSLQELAKHPKQGPATQYSYYWDEAKKALGEQALPQSSWVLMTKDVLPDSRSKSYAAQCKLVESWSQKTKISYQIPGTLEAATCILLEHVQSGTRLYSDRPWTYTRCHEKVAGCQMAVGGFAASGLRVNDDGVGVYVFVGVASLRKF